MADVDAVIDLLERWRDATGVGRLRIGVDATRVIAELPPERKRALAVEVAERVAPQLVPAIEAESGDLSAEQVGALVDLLRRADRDQLDDLVSALRSGDVGEAAGIVGDAVDVVAGPDAETDALLDDPATEDDATAAEVVAPPPAPGHTDAPGPDAPPRPADEGPEAEHPEEAVAEGSEAGAAAGATGLSAAAAAAAEREDVEIGPDGSLELDEEAVRERLAEEAAQRAQEYRDSSSDVPRAPTYRAPSVDFTTDDAEFDFPDPSVESVAPLHARMDRPGWGVTDDRRLAAPPVSASVASITATSDGYRRRRAALYAIRDDRLDAEDVPEVVRSFDRDTDRSWIAGAALDAGLLEASDLEGLGLQPGRSPASDAELDE